jgi:hypothetical protein
VGDILRMHDRMRADNRLGHPLKEVVFPIAESVVHHCAASLDAHRGGTDEMEQREMLSVCAGNSIDGAELSHAICRTDGAKALDAGVAIGSIGCVQLVTATNPAHARIFGDRVTRGKRKVSRNTEYIRDADRLQPGEHMLNDSHRHSGLCTSQMGILEVSIVALLGFADFGQAHQLVEFFELDHLIVKWRRRAGMQ